MSQFNVNKSIDDDEMAKKFRKIMSIGNNYLSKTELVMSDVSGFGKTHYIEELAKNDDLDYVEVPILSESTPLELIELLN